MHKITFLLLFIFIQFSSLAQVRLDVEGDAKIVGKMNLTRTEFDPSLYIGTNAGASDLGGNASTFIGANAGASNTIAKGNTFLGYDAGPSSTGQFNTFFGYRGGFGSMFGHDNAFFGAYAGENNGEGSGNAFFGRSAGENSSSSDSNAFFGAYAGAFNTTGDSNSFFGRSAGRYHINGVQNTFIGSLSGNISGVDSLYGAIAIGYRAQVNCHNCAVIGGTGNNAINLGIGTREPQDRLHLYETEKVSIKLNTTSSGISSLKLYESGEFGFEIMNVGVTNRLFFHAYSNGTLTPMASWSRDGYLNNFGHANIHGNIYQNGSLIHSDKRYKKQIKKIDNSLALLQRINGVSYAYRDQEFAARNFSKKRTLGVIAQEVEKVFPNLVHENEDGYKSVNYDGLIPVLIEATKAQQQLINQQEQENIELNKVVNRQAKQLANQQAQIDKLSGLVEKILEGQHNFPKTNNYNLPLLQKASLGQNQPNPFHQSTLIDYFLPENVQQASIQITALDGKILGQVNIDKTGKGQVDIQANTYPAGTYYYALIVDGVLIETKKMVLMR